MPEPGHEQPNTRTQRLPARADPERAEGVRAHGPTLRQGAGSDDGGLALIEERLGPGEQLTLALALSPQALDLVTQQLGFLE